MPSFRIALLFAACVVLGGAAQRPPHVHLATGRIIVTAWPYFPGSIIPLRISGFAPPYRVALLGPGHLASGAYAAAPAASPQRALLVAGSAAGLAATTLRIVPPPSPERPFAVVASYDDGLIFHDLPNLSVLGVLSIAGAPGGVAVGAGGTIAAPDTDGESLMIASLSPWKVAAVAGVPTGDDLVVESRSGSVFVTNRDAGGAGALTRVDRTGGIARVVTGTTAEGLAIDERRHVVYVANTNDGTIAVVDSRSMRLLRRFHAIDRVFSLALAPGGSRLYAVSNQSAGSLFAAPGAVVAFLMTGARPRIVARSAALNFPLGIALDASAQQVFVTEEGLSTIDVLDAHTLKATRPPIRTCTTPWKPTFDAPSGRLYVPCAQSGALDVFATRTLRRITGAPFKTGGYPLAVAIWRPSKRVLPRNQ